MTSIMSGSDLEIETINPTQELVTFDHVKQRYYPNSKFSVGYKLGENLEPTSKDWIGVFQSDWSAVNEYITFQWASQTMLCPNSPRLRRVTFEKFSPLKYCLPGNKYRCLYVSHGDHVIGVSSSFVLLAKENSEYELNWLELDQENAGANDLVTETSFTLVDLSSGSTSGTSEESLEEESSKDVEKPITPTFDTKTLSDDFQMKLSLLDLDFLNQIGSTKEEATPADWQSKYYSVDNKFSLLPFMPVLSHTKPKPVVELFQEEDNILESLFQPELTTARAQRDQAIPLMYKKDRSDDVIDHGILDLLFCENNDEQKPLDLSLNMDASFKENLTCLDQSIKRQLLAFSGGLTYASWKNDPSVTAQGAISCTSSSRKERIPKMCRKRQGFCVYKNIYPNFPKKRSTISRKEMIEYQRKRQRSTRNDVTQQLKEYNDDVTSHVKTNNNDFTSYFKTNNDVTSHDKTNKKGDVTSRGNINKKYDVKSCGKTNKDDVKSRGKTNKDEVTPRSPSLATGSRIREVQTSFENMKLVPVNTNKSKKNYNYNLKRVNAVKLLKQLFGGENIVTSLRSVIRSENCLNCVINQSMYEDYRKSNRRADVKIDKLEKENRELSYQLHLKTREVERLKEEATAKTMMESHVSDSSDMDTMMQFLHEAEEINTLLDDALRVSLDTNKAFMSRKQQTDEVVTQDVAVSCENVESEESSGEETDSEGWTVKSPRLVVRLRSAISKRERTLKHLQDKIENLGVQIGTYEDDIKDLRSAMKLQRNHTTNTHKEVLKLRKQNDIMKESKKQFCCWNTPKSPENNTSALKGEQAHGNTAEKGTQGTPFTSQDRATTTQDAPFVNPLSAITKPFSQVVKEDAPFLRPDRAISKEIGAVLKEECALLKDDCAIQKNVGTVTKKDAFTTHECQTVEPLPACQSCPKFENWKSFRQHLKAQISSGTCSVCSMTFSPNVDRRLIEEHITFHMQFDI